MRESKLLLPPRPSRSTVQTNESVLLIFRLRVSKYRVDMKCVCASSDLCPWGAALRSIIRIVKDWTSMNFQQWTSSRIRHWSVNTYGRRSRGFHMSGHSIRFFTHRERDTIIQMGVQGTRTFSFLSWTMAVVQLLCKVYSKFIHIYTITEIGTHCFWTNQLQNLKPFQTSRTMRFPA